MHPSPRLIRIVRRLLLTAVGTATLLALFVTIENWRGDRAWAALEREMRARGERVHFAEFEPPPVPDEQNFFATPLMAEVLSGHPGDASQENHPTPTQFHGFTNFPGHESSPPDFTVLRARLQQNGFLKTPFTDDPVLDVLRSLQPFEPLLDELRASARTRHHARIARHSQPSFSIRWMDNDSVFRLGNALCVRACAEIALGKAAEAHADIFALQRYANGLTAHPASLLQLLIGLNNHGSARRAIIEGIRRRTWTGAQLADFQNQLAEFRALPAFCESLLTERAIAFYVIDSKPPMPEWPPWLFHGWAQQNKVSLYRLQQSEIFSAFTMEPARIMPLLLKRPRPPAGLFRHWVSPYEVLSRQAMANVDGILIDLGSDVDRLALASVSCALERHRLAHGRYSDALADLVPRYLPAIPTGIFDSEPVRYLALPDGAHQLRTSGKNGRDDQGTADDVVLTLPRDT